MKQKRRHPDDLQRDDSEINLAIRESTLGLVLIGRSARGVCAVILGDDRRSLEREAKDRFPAATLIDADVDADADADLDELAAGIVAFMESPRYHPEVPLDLRGTEFQQTVWSALRSIPPGETASYTEIATRIGRPKAARAVAQACAANPLAVIVPCHRILRRDGSLSGYRWGIERKRALLDREAAVSAPTSTTIR